MVKNDKGGTLANVQRICLHMLYAIYDELSLSMVNPLPTLTSSKTAIWNTRQIAISQQSLPVKDYRLLQMIRSNIFTHLTTRFNF